MQLLQAVHGKKQSPLTTKTTFICKFSRESDKSINEKRSMVNCTCHYNVFCPRFDKAGMVCCYHKLLDPSAGIYHLAQPWLLTPMLCSNPP